ncbi:hypothetical protein DESC_880127 [Desulfosarcina cetonica]|nr:hypothetical protein DESC_880127 [Desulfosarcina cetonica]
MQIRVAQTGAYCFGWHQGLEAKRLRVNEIRIKNDIKKCQ